VEAHTLAVAGVAFRIQARLSVLVVRAVAVLVVSVMA
jgi:hypothetical protein